MSPELGVLVLVGPFVLSFPQHVHVRTPPRRQNRPSRRLGCENGPRTRPTAFEVFSAQICRRSTSGSPTAPVQLSGRSPSLPTDRPVLRTIRNPCEHTRPFHQGPPLAITDTISGHLLTMNPPEMVHSHHSSAIAPPSRRAHGRDMVADGDRMDAMDTIDGAINPSHIVNVSPGSSPSNPRKRSILDLSRLRRSTTDRDGATDGERWLKRWLTMVEMDGRRPGGIVAG